ncbi:MAG: AEC family transporter, partial [Deltaproteobacteria bacterium]|nr:AEC family transporter [Deltaproteobacteria bacterium]
ADFNFALLITAPIFFILALGVLFKRIGLVTEDFARIGSDLVFKVTLPCLLFVKLVKTDFLNGLPVALIVYALLATVLLFLVLDRLIAPQLHTSQDRGVFVQGAFRSNMGIIGLAYCLSAFGEGVVTAASIYLAFMTTLFNVLAVITLTRHRGQAVGEKSVRYILQGIVKNPLILAIVAGVFISLANVHIPDILLNTGSYFAQMTLPLALLCAGATIRLQEFQTSRPLYWAVSAKLLIIPLLITAGGVVVGLRGETLGVLYLMCAAPTAAASYPMAQAMNANHHLAAAIIAATSIGSLLSTTLGIFLLRQLGLI